MKCKNCKKKNNGNFCNNCGQKKFTRLTLKHLLNNISDSFNLEKGFIITLKLLIFNSNKIINDYLSGKIKSYFNPVKLFIITLSFSGYITYLAAKNSGLKDNLDNPTVWLIGYLSIFLPIFSFFTYLLSRKKFNYVENLVINLYFLSIVNLITSLLFVFLQVLKKMDSFLIIEYLIYFMLLAPIIYFTWVYYKLIKQNIILIFIFCFLNYFSSLLILISILGILGIKIDY